MLSPERKFLRVPNPPARRLAVLKLMAQGDAVPAIANCLKISTRTVETHRDRLRREFGADSGAKVVFKAAGMGIISLDDATKDLDIERIRSLTPTELDILQKMTNNEGEKSRNAEIASSRGVKKKTIEEQFRRIFIKLHVKNRIQAGLMFMAAKKLSLIQYKQ